MIKLTQSRLNRGERTLEILKQGVNQPMPVEHQVVSLYTVLKDMLMIFRYRTFVVLKKNFLAYVDANKPEILASIRDTKDLTADNEKALVEAIKTFQEKLCSVGLTISSTFELQAVRAGCGSKKKRGIAGLSFGSQIRQQGGETSG